MRILQTILLALSSLSAILPTIGAAQTYPDRPIKLVMPFPPGSATDATTRVVADELRKVLGQPVVIENQVGADGLIAAQAVKRASPDGYTILVSTNSAHAANKALYTTLPYDPEKDFDPVAGIILNPVALLVRKDFPADDMNGFVKVAHQRGSAKPITFASGNTAGAVSAYLMKLHAKLEITHVPYRGTPQALQDLVGGQVDALFADPYSSSPFVSGGQLKALAVTSSSRHAMLPNVPTMTEVGYKDVGLITWVGLFAPAGTDPAIVTKLNREVNAILVKPAVKEALLRMGTTPWVMSPRDLRSFVSREILNWRTYVEVAGIPKK